MDRTFSHAAAPIGLAVALMLAGCGPKAPHAAPGFSFFGQYRDAPAGAPVLLTNAAWWRGFSDPVLERLVSEALSANLSIAAARERVIAAQAAARAIGPAATGSLEAAAQRRLGEAGDSTSGTAALGLSWLLDPWGARRASLAAAQARVEAADAETDAARLLVLQSLCEAYVELRYQQRLLALRHEDIAGRQETLAIARTLQDAGTATALDVTRAQAQLAEARTEAPLIEAAIRGQENRIAVLAGRAPGSGGPEAGAAGPQPLPRIRPEIGIPADLLRNRPDIRIAERLYYAALSETEAAEAARWPRLSLTGEITLDAIRHGGSGRTLYFGPALVLPDLGGAQARAQEEAAASAARQAHLDWTARVLGALEEVESALADYEASHRARAEADRSLALHRRTRSMTRDLVRSGEATFSDLIEADRAGTAAAQGLAGILRRQGLDFVALNIRVGSGSAGPAG